MPVFAATSVSNRRRILGLIVLVAFVLRVGWWLYATPEPVSDFQVYVRLAENLLDRGFFGVDQPSALWLPGFPFLLAGAMLVSRATPWLSFVTVVLSTATTVLVYLVGRRYTGSERIGLMAAAVYATMPTFVLYAPILGTEHLFVPLLLGVIALVGSPERRGPWWAVLAGFLAGLAVLTRGEMLFSLPVVLAIVWFTGRDARRQRIRMVGLMVLSVVLTVGPWVVRNAVVVQPGINLSTVGGMNFYFGHRPDGYGFTTDVPWPPGDDRAASRVGWEVGLRSLREDPTLLVRSIRDGTYGLLASPGYVLYWSVQRPVTDRFGEWEPDPVPFQSVLGKVVEAASAAFLVLATAAFLTWRAWPTGFRVLLVGLLATNWLGHAVLFFGHPRFRYSVSTVASIAVAVTIVGLWDAGRIGFTVPPSEVVDSGPRVDGEGRRGKATT